MNLIFKINLLLYCLSMPFWGRAQYPIEFENSSFEGKSGEFKSAGWQNCEAQAGDFYLPFFHNYYSNLFSVKTVPVDRNSFLALVTRNNGTRGSVGQQLIEKLKKNKRYQFSIALCRSSSFLSRDRIENEWAPFNRPIVLEVWGGNEQCSQAELLAVTEPIDHGDWRRYEFNFQVGVTPISTITFAVNYVNSDDGFYNGNILLDDCSNIIKVSKSKFKAGVRQSKIKFESTDFINRFDLYRILRDSTVLAKVKKKKLNHLQRISIYDLVEVQIFVDGNFKGYFYRKNKAGLNRTEELPKVIDALNKLALPESTRIIWGIKGIIPKVKDKKITSYKGNEYEYYRRGDEMLKTALTKERFLSKIEAYIKEHREAILNELKSLAEE